MSSTADPNVSRRVPTERRGRAVRLQFDGDTVEAFEGESVFAALLASGHRRLRNTERRCEPRGGLCGIGVCFDCLVEVDGRPNAQACLTKVADGMQVRTQAAAGPFPESNPASRTTEPTETPVVDCPVLVIGGGPAGQSAAIAAAEAGLDVTLIDENDRLGGQIYRQPPATFSDQPKDDKGATLRQRVAELDRITVVPKTRVWGIFDGRRVATVGPEGAAEYRAERLILAPGAHELVPPFPGWTLPGVLTPGGAQASIKGMGVIPGKRALVVGTGPFLLVVAQTLHRAGVEVAAVVESVRRSEVLRATPGMLREPGLMAEGWGYLSELRRARIPILSGQVIVRAEGDGHVERVTVAKADRDWRPSGQETTFDVDTLCVGYGFVPRIQLPHMAGCRLGYRDELGGWTVEADETGRTSVDRVWTAGDGAGVAGSAVAELEGRLAGITAAHDAGAVDASTFHREKRTTLKRLTRLRRFRAALDKLSQPRAGLTQLASQDTLLCRCEELSRAEVDESIGAGNHALRELRVASRLGMGPCQGRMCWPSASRYIAEQTGRTIESLGPVSVRPPVQPVTLGEIVDGQPGGSSR